MTSTISVRSEFALTWIARRAFLLISFFNPKKARHQVGLEWPSSSSANLESISINFFQCNEMMFFFLWVCSISLIKYCKHVFVKQERLRFGSGLTEGRQVEKRWPFSKSRKEEISSVRSKKLIFTGAQGYPDKCESMVALQWRRTRRRWCNMAGAKTYSPDKYLTFRSSFWFHFLSRIPEHAHIHTQWWKEWVGQQTV